MLVLKRPKTRISSLITTRIRRMGEGNVFTLFVSSYVDGGRYTITGLAPGQVLMLGVPQVPGGTSPG